jgi:hypothetical protein
MSFLAQDGDSTVLCYSHAGVLKREQADAVLAFTDYWKEVTGHYPAELVFDSRLTTHKSLAELNRRGIRFLTLRRKNKTLVQSLMTRPATDWTPCKLDVPHRKYKTPKVIDEEVTIQGYKGKIRQIAAKDLGREKPTLLITNTPATTVPSTLLTRYAKRMIIENAIADGVHFFHVDALCSSLEVEVDFSVALSVIGNGLYHLLASKLRGFEHCTAKQIHRKIVNTLAHVQVAQDKTIDVHFPLRAHNPLLREAGFHNKVVNAPWLLGAHVRYTLPTDESAPPIPANQ